LLNCKANAWKRNWFDLLSCILVYTEMDARLFVLGDLAYNG
jgi:hypothetical protein